MFDANRIGGVHNAYEALMLAQSLANRVTGVEDLWVQYSVLPLAGILCAVSPIGGAPASCRGHVALRCHRRIGPPRRTNVCMRRCRSAFAG